jgi:O-antigen/teichoic acid export membrane protein
MLAFDTDKMKRWAGKGTIAVVDQAFISGSNFAVSILLARWSSTQEYGAFALAFALFLLLSQLQQSVLLEPMSVFGASYSGARLKRYYGSLLHMQNGMLFAITIPLAIAAIVAPHFGAGPQLVWALWGVAFASPFVLLFWMARRAFYLEHTPGPAAVGAVVYSIATLIGLVLVQRMGALTSFSAFVVMGAAALVTSIGMFRRLRPQFRRKLEDLNFIGECRQHWRYGGWALAGALALWVPQNIYYAILSGAAGMSAAADIRALINLALPLQRVTVALGLLLLPYTARIYAERGHAGAKSLTRMICYLFSAGSIAYWAFVLLFRNELFQLLYDGKYSSVRYLLPWLALSSVLNTVISALIVTLRAMRSPASVFYASGASSIVALGIGIPATWFWGIEGVVFSFIVSNVVTLAAAWWMMNRRLDTGQLASHNGIDVDSGFGLQTLPEAKAS